MSSIRAMFDEAGRLEREGEELIRLEVGEPDFDTPEEVIKGAIKAFEEGQTHYTPVRGVYELRERISEKLEKENGIYRDPESDIVVTSGGMEAIYTSLLMTVDRGDEILIPDPGWPNFKTQVLMVDGVPTEYKLDPEEGFQVRLEKLKELIDSDTKGIVINSPSNPLGIVFNEEVLEGVADIAEDEDILIYSDESYEKIIFGDNTHISIGSFDKVKDQVLTIQTFSKSYAMTGWRIGYVAGHEDIINEISKVRSCTSTCTNSISQAGAIEALKHGEDSVRKMRSTYERRKDLLMDLVESMPSAWCLEPQGAFYAFLNVSELSGSSMEIAKEILRDKKVVTVPGSGFGENGEGFLRISFATNEKDLEEGLKRIRSFIDERK